MLDGAALSSKWATCVERLKDRHNNRSLWEALEHTRAVTIEDNLLIIGMEPSDFNGATHIQQTAIFPTVRQMVREVFQEPLEPRLIEGVTLEDWKVTKDSDARVAAMRKAGPVQRAPSTVDGSSWEALYDHLSRLFAQSPNRALPQGKARYANEALYSLMEAMDTLYPNEPDDPTERSLARAIERIANVSEIPAPVLAFELERLRAWSKANPA